MWSKPEKGGGMWPWQQQQQQRSQVAWWWSAWSPVSIIMLLHAAPGTNNDKATMRPGSPCVCFLPPLLQFSSTQLWHRALVRLIADYNLALHWLQCGSEFQWLPQAAAQLTTAPSLMEAQFPKHRTNEFNSEEIWQKRCQILWIRKHFNCQTCKRV